MNLRPHDKLQDTPRHAFPPFRETGTGKKLVARHLHARSGHAVVRRCGQPIRSPGCRPFHAAIA